jgi:hypothetical protein
MQRREANKLRQFITVTKKRRQGKTRLLEGKTDLDEAVAI